MKKEPSACAAPGSFFVVDEKPQRKRGLSHPNAASVDPISVGSPSVCIHGTVFSDVVPLVMPFNPFGCGHGAVGLEKVPFVATLFPVFDHSCAPGIKIIPFAVYLNPSVMFPCAGRMKHIGFTVDIPEAGRHDASLRVEIVPFTVLILPPAGDLTAIFVIGVIFAARFFPLDLFCRCRIKFI